MAGPLLVGLAAGRRLVRDRADPPAARAERRGSCDPGPSAGAVQHVILSGEGKAAADPRAARFRRRHWTPTSLGTGFRPRFVGYALRWRAASQDRTRSRPARAADPAGRRTRDRGGAARILPRSGAPRRAAPAADGAHPRARATLHGRLRVPAHGAYTMRTEHAVLTGPMPRISASACSTPTSPMAATSRRACPLRARDAGFETVFVHPFHRDFFNRAAVVTRLGFDRLIMEDDFAGAPRVGPYVGDAALADRVLAEVRARARRRCSCTASRWRTTDRGSRDACRGSTTRWHST